ncbi:hypothetical protein RCH12_001020 [Cryobacterium sp. MP_3.1]|uniref:hypothetical protein n=1 Tax=Cryobacterium sp. MP_3.1 TaxID=3071711 RepID=UPI002E0395BB|nr:hypothetical protein [Cryobacterium sp. MP_3.1]
MTVTRDTLAGLLADVRAGPASRFEGIPDVHYGDDRHGVCGDELGVSEWTLTGTSVSGQRLDVRGVDLLEFDAAEKIRRKDSLWKILDGGGLPPRR